LISFVIDNEAGKLFQVAFPEILYQSTEMASIFSHYNCASTSLYSLQKCGPVLNVGLA
jgi:hypothetical protein